MEEDILLDMYRQSWDAFLEAYKERLEENEALIKLVATCEDIMEKADLGEDVRKIQQDLGKILEG